MVREYKKTPGTRSYKGYNEDRLNKALEEVAENGMSVKAAALKYNISYGTLYNKYHGKHVQVPGDQTVFSQAEETSIIDAATKCADWGFPLDLLDLRMLAKAYLDRTGRVVPKFQNNVPGKDWALFLLRRHKHAATQLLASNISKARAKVSRETLETYFNNLENNIPASNLFNYDETNVGDDPGKKKAVYRRGVKYPEKVINHSKSCTTIMICGAAEGTLLPPYVICKSEHLYNTWKEGGVKGEPCCSKPCCSKGCRFNRTSHGWIDTTTFQDWFETGFLPHAKRLEGRKVLIGDNLASHFNDKVIKLCEENNISFVCLVPNSTHICQPLDVAFFKPFKVSWRAVITNYKLQNKTPGIPKENFPLLLKRALEKMDEATPQTKSKPGDNDKSAIKRNLINGFYATGLYPLNKQKVLDRIPSAIHDPGAIVTDSLTELLSEQRFGQKKETHKRKKKRLNIKPGRSISTNSSSDSEEDREAESVTVQESEDEEENIATQDLQEVDYIQPKKDLLAPEVFVLVKFLSGKRHSTIYKYVCKIREQFSENEYTVVGLRSVDEEHTVFKLVPKDISTVTFSDILAVLPAPSEHPNSSNYYFDKIVDVF